MPKPNREGETYDEAEARKAKRRRVWAYKMMKIRKENAK